MQSREKIIALLSENDKLTAAGLAAEIGVTAKALMLNLLRVIALLKNALYLQHDYRTGRKFC